MKVADFTSTDCYSAIRFAPNSAAARHWLMANVDRRFLNSDGSISPYPGYAAHVILPRIRDAGLTVDGDLDEQGRIKIRARG